MASLCAHMSLHVERLDTLNILILPLASVCLLSIQYRQNRHFDTQILQFVSLHVCTDTYIKTHQIDTLDTQIPRLVSLYVCIDTCRKTQHANTLDTQIPSLVSLYVSKDIYGEDSRLIPWIPRYHDLFLCMCVETDTERTAG